MKKIKFLLIIAVASVLVISSHRIDKLKSENERLSSNQEILLSQKQDLVTKMQSYKVSDSLNAIKVSGLQLTLSEYKKYRTEDLQLIEQLKIKKANLQNIIDLQSETISRFSTNLRDSIRIDTVYSIIDTLKYFTYKSKWTDVSGFIGPKHDSVSLQIKNRESLKVIETTVYKRFLGFLWRTNKIKSRQVDIVSENPNTKILGCEYISIKRKQ